MPRSTPKQAKINITAPTEGAAAKGAVEAVGPTGKQGRGLASTDLSGMRSMVGSYQSGKTTLGAG